MIKSIFIANRGEIAVRIIRACKELGIQSVIGYSEADRDSLPVRMADKKICLGPAVASESYLNINNIVAAASGYKCEAVHPGVGFLSEREIFAQKVLDAGIEFIGPRPESIALLGDKVSAKKAAIQSGVPVVPGSEGAVSDVKDVQEFVKEHGYPVIIKASAGGGGKGMRIINSDEELKTGFQLTATEAEKAFGDGRIYVEKFLTQPRHVEIQLIADKHGHVVHLYERDCTVQFKHQKLIEESPCPVLSDELREKMGATSVNLLQHLGYENAATVEYLLDGENFYFMEVNARIQVEHPVTELVSGVDLIQEQIRVASGETLSITQQDISLNGYAMECRINAITPGRMEKVHLPGGYGVRIDTWISQGDVISPFYDSMLLKLLIHAKNRSEGIQRMLRALEELNIEGPGFSYNKKWHQDILNHKKFRAAEYHTQFIEETGILDSKN